jgi:hypothetical protein
MPRNALESLAMPAYELARSITINCSTQAAYELVSDYSTWTKWSPWLLAEPATKVNTSSDPRSIGSKYEWKGEITGQGELTTIELKRNESMIADLRFIKPFPALAKTGFLIAPVNNGIKLTWTMQGKMPWFLFWMIPMMKTLIGMDYQRGLTMIKDLLETGSIPSRLVFHDREEIQGFKMAGVVGSCSVDNIGPAMEKTFEESQAEFRKLGLPMNGEMISVYTKFRMKAGVFEYICGYVIPDEVDVHSQKLTVWKMPPGRAYRIEHVGSYRHLGNGWSAANQIVRARKWKQSRIGTYEIYRNADSAQSETEAITDIYLPLK